jgi:hypothetical protein
MAYPQIKDHVAAVLDKNPMVLILPAANGIFVALVITPSTSPVSPVTPLSVSVPVLPGGGTIVNAVAVAGTLTAKKVLAASVQLPGTDAPLLT